MQLNITLRGFSHYTGRDTEIRNLLFWLVLIEEVPEICSNVPESAPFQTVIKINRVDIHKLVNQNKPNKRFRILVSHPVTMQVQQIQTDKCYQM